jgi:hypothetical protein
MTRPWLWLSCRNSSTSSCRLSTRSPTGSTLGNDTRKSVSTAMATQPTAATPPPGSARELVKAMRERNAPRRAEVQRRVASLRRIAEQLRAASR